MTPDRTALAAAIQCRAKFADDLTRILAAREPARLRIREAEQALAAAELTLREHVAAEPRAVVDALIAGQPADSATGIALNDAVTEAMTTVEISQRISRALAERERDTQDDLNAATAAAREAAVRVARNSDEATELVAYLAAAKRAVALLNSIAASITGVFAIDTSLLPHISNAEASAAIKPWSEALAALENDAEAPLPTIHLSEGVRLTSPPSAGSPDFLGGSSGDPASTRPNGRAA